MALTRVLVFDRGEEVGGHLILDSRGYKIDRCWNIDAYLVLYDPLAELE